MIRGNQAYLPNIAASPNGPLRFNVDTQAFVNVIDRARSGTPIDAGVSRFLNLHLGARDPANGGFVMLGKTFKGMTDQMLAWQTEQFLAREIARDRYTVYVRPELVVEIAFNDLQASPHYPGGLALRFARVKAYRPDKRADEADTIDTVRAIYQRQAGTPAGDAA